MGYSRFLKYLTVLILTGIAILFFYSCTSKDKRNTGNTFYIELVNFKYDSLQQNLASNIFGKVSFHKNRKLEIVSLNYITDDFPPMHYFVNVESLGKDIKENTIKIRIEYIGEFTIDSINYSLQKFRYRNKEWVKTSDMGVIKEFKKSERPENIIAEYVEKIVLNSVQYSYN